jgi:hypothetical protein
MLARRDPIVRSMPMGPQIIFKLRSSFKVAPSKIAFTRAILAAAWSDMTGDHSAVWQNIHEKSRQPA